MAGTFLPKRFFHFWIWGSVWWQCNLPLVKSSSGYWAATKNFWRTIRQFNSVQILQTFFSSSLDSKLLRRFTTEKDLYQILVREKTGSLRLSPVDSSFFCHGCMFLKYEYITVEVSSFTQLCFYCVVSLTAVFLFSLLKLPSSTLVTGYEVFQNIKWEFSNCVDGIICFSKNYIFSL